MDEKIANTHWIKNSAPPPGAGNLDASDRLCGSEPAVSGRPPDPGKYFEADAPCGRCGCRLRYIRNKSCVECARVWNARAAGKRRRLDMSAWLLTGLLIALSALLTTLAALLAGLVLLVHSSSSMWLVL